MLEHCHASRSDRFNLFTQPHEIAAIVASKNRTAQFASADICIAVAAIACTRRDVAAPEVEVKVERESGLFCTATGGFAASCRFTQI